MTRDSLIGIGLLVPGAVLGSVGLMVDRPFVFILGVVLFAAVVPISYKLVRYPSTRVVSFGDLAQKTRASKRGWLNSGMLVCFSGIDGAGKTTVANAVVDAMEERGICASHRWARWRPIISYPLMGVLYVLLGWRRKDYARSSILRRIWGYFLLADLLIYSVVLIYPRLLRGQVVCVDRFVLDTLVEMDYDNLYSDSAAYLLRELLPTPQCHFYLDVPPRVAIGRKGDTGEMLERLGIDQPPEQYLERRRELYHDHVADSCVVELDTTESLEKTTNRAVKAAIQEYVDF